MKIKKFLFPNHFRFKIYSLAVEYSGLDLFPILAQVIFSNKLFCLPLQTIILKPMDWKDEILLVDILHWLWISHVLQSFFQKNWK